MKFASAPEDYDSNEGGSWDDSDPGPTEIPMDHAHPYHVEGADPWAPGVRAADIPVVPRTKPLVPNKTDISAHLYALFSPAFVQPYQDAWFEIAYSNLAGEVNAAEIFSVFDLEPAVAFAEQKSRVGCNVYVGPAIRQGEHPASGRASDKDVVTSSCAWAEFDGAGDGERISA